MEANSSQMIFQKELPILQPVRTSGVMNAAIVPLPLHVNDEVVQLSQAELLNQDSKTFPLINHLIF